MKPRPKSSAAFPQAIALAIVLLLPLTASPASSSQPQPPAGEARAIVASAVKTELYSNHTDHTAYMYLDHDVTPDHDTLNYVVETPKGNLKKLLEDHGRPLSPDQRKAEDDRIRKLLSDPSQQARDQRDNAHDDEQAEQMLKLLPQAYLWTIVSEQGDLITLAFKPDPAFDPPNLEARVLASMGGEIVVARGDDRIRTIRGTLLGDVKFFGGLVGRLHQGGSFQVERREVAPHHWQITESHVHILGKVLFFKSIGSIEDETRTDFKPSPAQNLQQAYEILKEIH